MVSVPVQCPYCQSTEVIKAGKQANGTQRYRRQNGQCARRIFLLQYKDRGRIPEIRRQVVDMALSGSGIRDTARVLRISPTTMIVVLKKSAALQHANLALAPLVHAPAALASDQCAPPKWMKCGDSSGPKRVRGGCGMRLIITPGECSRTSLALGRIQNS